MRRLLVLFMLATGNNFAEAYSNIDEELNRPHSPEFYTRLGLDPARKSHYSQDDIKRAYFKMAKRWHPDRVQDAKEKDNYHQAFVKIGEAYSVLNKPDDRALYDRMRPGAAPRPASAPRASPRTSDFSDIFAGYTPEWATDSRQDFTYRRALSPEDFKKYQEAKANGATSFHGDDFPKDLRKTMVLARVTEIVEREFASDFREFQHGYISSSELAHRFMMSFGSNMVVEVMAQQKKGGIEVHQELLAYLENNLYSRFLDLGPSQQDLKRFVGFLQHAEGGVFDSIIDDIEYWGAANERRNQLHLDGTKDRKASGPCSRGLN